MTSLVASSSGQDSQEHEVSQRGDTNHHTILFFRVLVREDSFIIISCFPEILELSPAMVEAFRNLQP